MILKIHQSKYYGYQNKNKALFMKKYRSLGLKWMTNVSLNGEMVDGWMNDDKSQYLLKLPEDGEYKRFNGNAVKMIDFLKSCGAEEIEGEVKGVHIDYNDNKGFITQEERFGHFVGADLYNSYYMRELLKNVPDDLGIVWNDRKEVKKEDKKEVVLINISSGSVIKRKIIVRIKV